MHAADQLLATKRIRRRRCEPDAHPWGPFAPARGGFRAEYLALVNSFGVVEIAPAQTPALRGAVLGAGDRVRSEGVHEREIFPGSGVAVGAQQWETVIPGVHQRQPEALDQRGVDIGDEVAEVVDADDDAGDAARLDR